MMAGIEIVINGYTMAGGLIMMIMMTMFCAVCAIILVQVGWRGLLFVLVSTAGVAFLIVASAQLIDMGYKLSKTATPVMVTIEPYE
jgi:hypothetical protein